MSDKIKISVPGKPEYISMVRLAVASLASTAGFDIEEIEDIKAAVSEVCTSIFCSQNKISNYQISCDVGERGLSISISDDESSVSEKTEAPTFQKNEFERCPAYEMLPMIRREPMIRQYYDTGRQAESDSSARLSSYELGLLVIKSLMDEVDISRREQNMFVHMIKHLGNV